MARVQKREYHEYAFEWTDEKAIVAAWKKEVELAPLPPLPPLRVSGIIGSWQCAYCGRKWDAKYIPSECPKCGVKDVHPR